MSVGAIEPADNVARGGLSPKSTPKTSNPLNQRPKSVSAEAVYSSGRWRCTSWNGVP